VIEFTLKSTDCDGLNWYSTTALMLGWIKNCTPGVNRLRVTLDAPLKGESTNPPGTKALW